MNEAGQLSGGPTHTTTRHTDQLIPINDISQLRSVQAMLEDARLSATTVGSIPHLTPQIPPPNSDPPPPTPDPIPPPLPHQWPITCQIVTQTPASQTMIHPPVTQTGNKIATIDLATIARGQPEQIETQQCHIAY